MKHVAGAKVLVVGSGSYVGNYIARTLRREGANVVAISSRDCDFLNRAQVLHFFSTLSLEHCTVLFLSVINKTVANDFESFEQNLAMVRNFVEAQEPASVGRVIYFSSVDVYGRTPKLPITEQTAIDPDTLYGLAKYNCEWMLLNSREVGRSVTVLRIPGVYGAAPNDRSVIGKLVSSIRNERSVRINGSGRSLRDYVFIEDLCKLLGELIPMEHRGVVNVATGQSYSILELAQMAGEALQQEYEIVHAPADLPREFDLAFDNSLLRSLLPDFNFTEIKDGLRSYA